ncbi:DNA cytosine methyltransferase [Megasphaera sp. WILCCON 0056]|uniref:DNA cytosine methyltransferase n=1 Tax=Megasphaera sp. WILCCON 0056 TaxID=3345340 RepID=UPI003A805877
MQTFPDTYTFTGKYASVRRQIGMAVPCELSRIVTQAVLDSFAGVDYPWIEPNMDGDQKAKSKKGRKNG